jgi:hypothetical protein
MAVSNSRHDQFHVAFVLLEAAGISLYIKPRTAVD